MSVFWRIAFCVAHIVSLVAIFMLYRDYNFVDPALYEAVKDQKSLDTLHVAVQIGRFDLASFFLGTVAILIALAAIFAFVEVKSRAERVAEEAAKAIVDSRVGSLFEEAMKTRAKEVAPMLHLSDAEEAKAMAESTELEPKR